MKYKVLTVASVFLVRCFLWPTQMYDRTYGAAVTVVEHLDNRRYFVINVKKAQPFYTCGKDYMLLQISA
jgi:hypothetical protein